MPFLLAVQIIDKPSKREKSMDLIFHLLPFPIKPAARPSILF